MADTNITADQTLPLSIDPTSITDREGNPAQVQNVTWATSDPTVITIEPASDNLSAVAVSHRVGEATILVQADADLGEGVKTLSGSHSISVQAGQAASITVVPGVPTPKDAPTPPEPVPAP
jgi:hypothetical protein